MVRRSPGKPSGIESKGKIISIALLPISSGIGEEIIVSVPGEIRIYATNIPAENRRVTLMHDPIYRMDVALYSSGYAQPPMTSDWIAGDRNSNT